MLFQLFEALVEAMEFREIDPQSICRIDSNVGYIWFKAGDDTYSVGISKVDFDLDEYAKTSSNI